MAEISKQNQSNKTTQDSNDFYDEKNLAMLCHLSSPIAFLLFPQLHLYWLIFPTCNWLAPLLIYLILKNKISSISVHVKKILNFQITFAIIIIIYQLLCILLYLGFSYYLSTRGNLEALSNLQFEDSLNKESIMEGIDLIMKTSPLLIYILGIFLIGLFGRIFLWAVLFTCSLIGSARAIQGKVFNYPFSLEIFK